VAHRILLPTKEMGNLPLFVIERRDANWEPQWAPLEHTAFASVVTIISKEIFDHASYGWTSPLVKALGLGPSGCLRKLPVISQQCYARSRCIHYDKKRCNILSKGMPLCFDPDGLANPDARRLGMEAISLWREGVHIILVELPHDE
jgi:hypothetical protein